MLTRYPLDPTGQSSTNLVVGEIHTLDANFDKKRPRILFPRLGAYYNDSLVVKQGTKKLTLNKDYLLTFFWQEATAETGNPVSVAFQIKNTKLVGDITINYQVVGGKYQDRFFGLDELLEVLPLNARNVFWDEVLEKPEAFVPTRHLHHINDVFGLSKLIFVVDQLRQSLERQSALKLKTVYNRFLGLKTYVDDNLREIDEVRAAIATLNANTGNQLRGYLTRNDFNTEVTRLLGEEGDRRISQMNELRELITALSNNQSTLQGNISTLNQSLTNINGSLSGLLGDEVRRLVQLVADKEAGVLTLINASASELTQAQQRDTTALTEAIAAAKAELNDTIRLLQQSLIRSNEQIQLLNQQLADAQNDDEVPENIATMITGLRSDYSELHEAYMAVVERLSATEQKTEDNSQALTNNILITIQSLEARLNQQTNDIDEELVTGLITENNNKINESIDGLKSELLAQIAEKAEELKTTLESLLERVIVLENFKDEQATINETLTTSNTALEEAKNNHEERIAALESSTDLQDLTNRLENKINELTTALSESRTALSDVLDPLKEKVNTNSETLNQLQNNVSSITSNVETIGERITTLEESANSKNDQFDEESLKRLVSNKLHEIIIEKREEYGDNALAIPNLIVYPDEEGGITFADGEGIRVYPITIMNTALENNELQRSVFTPNTVFEFEKTTTWSIPDMYDGLIAQVYVTSGIRGNVLANGNHLIYPPSTKMGYVKLKGGTNVPITVGSISSFGAYLTNDGIDVKGVIAPTYPIVIPGTTGLTTAEDIRQQIGKLGKVTIIV